MIAKRLMGMLLGGLLVFRLGAQEPVAVPGASAREPAAAPGASAEEQAVVREISKIRMFPREYAKYLRALGTRFRGNLWYLHDHVPLRTAEGREALEEAAQFLEEVKPMPEPMVLSEGLHRSARVHVLDQGPTGLLGHVGRDRSTPGQRMKRFGTPFSLMGEVINYGQETPRMTVIQLVIDDGVADRGHRKNLFNPKFRVAGAAIGYHKEYGSMTVVDLADAFTEPELQSKPLR